VLAFADDDVVVHDRAHNPAGLLDLLGHSDVVGARRRVARGVVVDEDQRGRVQLESALGHLPGIDRNMVNRADSQILLLDQDVLLIEEQHPKLLDLAARQQDVAEVDELRPGADDWPIDDLAARQPTGGSRHQPELEVDLGVYAWDPLQLVLRGRDGLVEATELSDQSLRERLHIHPRDRVEEDHLHQFVVGQTGAVGFQKARSQPLAVPPVMRTSIGNGARLGACAISIALIELGWRLVRNALVEKA